MFYVFYRVALQLETTFCRKFRYAVQLPTPRGHRLSLSVVYLIHISFVVSVLDLGNGDILRRKLARIYVSLPLTMAKKNIIVTAPFASGGSSRVRLEQAARAWDGRSPDRCTCSTRARTGP